jgi:hypothetical protein
MIVVEAPRRAGEVRQGQGDDARGLRWGYEHLNRPRREQGDQRPWMFPLIKTSCMDHAGSGMVKFQVGTAPPSAGDAVHGGVIARWCAKYRGNRGQYAAEKRSRSCDRKDGRHRTPGPVRAAGESGYLRRCA